MASNAQQQLIDSLFDDLLSHLPPQSEYTHQNAETLRRIQQNDTSLKELRIGLDGHERPIGDGRFTVPCEGDSGEYSTLGEAVATNNNLRKLKVHVCGHPLTIAEVGFFEGIKQNNSIHKLELHCGGANIAGEASYSRVAHEILKMYQESNNLTQLDIHYSSFTSDVSIDILSRTLRRSTNLTSVTLKGCFGRDTDLNNSACRAMASILEDPNCNIRYLSLVNNDISGWGVAIIASSLAENTTLTHLDLTNNNLDQGICLGGIFSEVLCNTTTINSTYHSNHTLEKLVTRGDSVQGPGLSSLLFLNRGMSKSHVAIRKILRFHPIIDMSQFYDWDSGDDQTLKALPYIVAWFERGREAIAELTMTQRESYYLNKRELSAIYQFARAMPLLFIPPSHTKAEGTKRKRDLM